MTSIKIFWVVALSVSCLSNNLIAQQTMKTNQQLDIKQQAIVTISAFTAKGDMAQLQKALNNGLDAQLTVNEIKEVLVQLYAYTGFPRSLNALNSFLTVLKQRINNSINDAPGRDPSPLPPGKSKLEFGTEMQTKLVGRPVEGELFEFAPAIDQFLKEHLFGDIFGRDNLDWKTRELATIAALASLGGVESQLSSHFGVGLYNGLTETELEHLVSIIHSRVDAKEGNTASQVLKKVLKGRNDNKATNQPPTEHALSTNDKMNHKKNSTGHAIFPKGEKTPGEYFTGMAWVNRLVQQDETGTYSIGNVVFEPGARTNWHIHPAGQTLIVFDGNGWYQEKGKSARSITKGDVVVVPSNTEHWHGAAKDNTLTHLAITNSKDGGVKWLQPVADKEYNEASNQ